MSKAFIFGFLLFILGAVIASVFILEPSYSIVILIFLLLLVVLTFYQFQKYVRNRPQERIRAIQQIAKQIEDEISAEIQVINLKNAPKEVVPLINAVNNLVSYFQDRYLQERDFTANASHELRTPLAGIRLQTEIAMEATDREMLQKSHRSILKAVDRATRLSEQLLILSRLTADRMELETEAVNIGRLTSRVIAELITSAESKNINLHIAHFDELYVEGNKDSLGILINNIIRNSITYCPNESYIEVQIRKNLANQVVLYIDDNGFGIPKNKRAFVLERFQKANRGSKIGTGLGLSIVKRIAELHNAELKLLDGKTGRGLCVQLIFPEY